MSKIYDKNSNKTPRSFTLPVCMDSKKKNCGIWDCRLSIFSTEFLNSSFAFLLALYLAAHCLIADLPTTAAVEETLGPLPSPPTLPKGKCIRPALFNFS